MKKFSRVIVMVFVACLIFGFSNLCWVYGGETPGETSGILCWIRLPIRVFH